MATLAFDTHKAVKALCDAGFDPSQAEAVTEQIGIAIGGDLATNDRRRVGGAGAARAAEAPCYDSGMRRNVLLPVVLVAATGLFGACDSLNPFSPGDDDTDTQPTFPNPIPNQTWTVGVVVNLTLPAANGGDAPLTYSLSPALPAGLAFNAGTRAVTGTPSAAQSSTSYIYTVTDNDSDSASMQFQASVAAASAGG